MSFRVSDAAAALLALALTAAGARADVAIEPTGQVASLPAPPHPHWIWVGDPIAERSALVDLESGEMLGSVGSGLGIPTALFPRRRAELYVSAIHYSRGDHGERNDALIVYDSVSLRPVAEVLLPAKRAIVPFTSGVMALSDDDRFAAAFNLTPATSLSIADLESRSFAGEIATPGCSLVYPAGARRFAMLCGDGALLLVTLDNAGRELSKLRSQPFFDPERDPVTEKAVRWGDRWLFVSFEGQLHSVDVSGEEPRFDAPWSLLSEADRAESWRIGGTRHLAVHEATGQLYSLVHQGGPDTHKDAGSEIWVYDLARRERVQRIEVASAGLTFMGYPIEIGKDWIWPFDRLAAWLLSLLSMGADEVLVSQDAQPLLVTSSEGSSGLAIYDAQSGEFLRRVYSGNFANLGLALPTGWAANAAEPPPVSAAPGPDPIAPAAELRAPEYWRYCALDGFLSDCCGGGVATCPPGTEMSSVSWLGTCRNPADGKDYVISYNDCCGKTYCGKCFVKRNEGEKPVYYTSKNNDIGWCMGTQSAVYNSTAAVVVGVAGP
jgi:methylamine dehydrogenase heavy chain